MPCRNSAVSLLTLPTRSPPKFVAGAYINPLYQRRSLFDSLLSSTFGPCPLRSLTHTKLIHFPAGVVFKAVSDVAGYPSFLPFAISSNVTARDSMGHPTRATLKVGYAKFGLEEDWESSVHCDPVKGIVEASSSGAKSDGLFEALSTRWHIEPSKTTRNDTAVKLDVNVKFRNPVYDQMFAQVEGKVASTIMSAFEKRVEELHRETKPKP